jgi:hypothetical protein
MKAVITIKESDRSPEWATHRVKINLMYHCPEYDKWYYAVLYVHLVRSFSGMRLIKEAVHSILSNGHAPTLRSEDGDKLTIFDWLTVRDSVCGVNVAICKEGKE